MSKNSLHQKHDTGPMNYKELKMLAGDRDEWGKYGKQQTNLRGDKKKRTYNLKQTI